MKKLNLVFAILIAFVTLTSCNNTDTISDPIITSVLPTSVNVGDVITINGQNFDTAQTYTIQFNGVEGAIIQVTETTIKVEVPEKSTSGEVIIIYNGKTINLGTTTIINIFTSDVTFLTQQEVDDFGANNYTKIVGNIDVGVDSDTPVTSVQNLNALENITIIVGDLRMYQNKTLVNLTGLNNLTSVTNFVLYHNTALTNLDALSNLTTINGNLYISENDELQNLDGLSNLTTLGGFNIENSSKVNNLNFLSNITSLTGDLRITGTDALTNYNGLSNITSIGGDLNLQSNNFTNIDMFSNLTTVGRTINFYGNNSLENFDGFSSLTSIGKDLWISDNLALTNVDGLSNLTAVGDRLHFKGNTSLTSFCGLSTLIIDNNFSNSYSITDNAYNPMQQDIIDGNCSN